MRAHRKEREERKEGSNKWMLMSGARCRRDGMKKHVNDKLSKKELEEIKQLKEESLRGEYILWSELKKELKALPILRE